MDDRQSLSDKLGLLLLVQILPLLSGWSGVVIGILIGPWERSPDWALLIVLAFVGALLGTIAGIFFKVIVSWKVPMVLLIAILVGTLPQVLFLLHVSLLRACVAG